MSPVFGATVKELLPPTATLFIVDVERVNAELSDRAIVKFPVGWLPVLVIVTVSELCVP